MPIPPNQRARTLALPLIRHYEGFSPTPYRCPGGYWTIGYGHVISTPDTIPRITEPEAQYLLIADIARTQASVCRLIHVPLTPHQQAALISFTFNLGAGALQRSTLRRTINREAHAEVPAQLMRWVWAGGQRLHGLILRRKAEADLYLST